MNECDICNSKGCENLIKKTFAKENNDLIVVEYSLYYCCYDNGIKRDMLKFWCDECLSNDTVKQRLIDEDVPLTTPNIRNTNPYNKWIDLKNE